MAVHGLLLRSADTRPDATALVVGDERTTYGQLRHSVTGLAGWLRANGLAEGDRVMIVVPNSRPTVVAMFAAWYAGAIAVVVDPAAPPERLRQLIADAQPRAVIAASSGSARWLAALAALDPSIAPPVATVWVDGDTAAPGTGASGGPPIGAVTDFATATAAAPLDPVDVDSDSPASIIYTSGSTGRPKGVVLSHRGIERVVTSVGGYLEHTADDVVLCLLQLAFGYGLLQVLVTFAGGGRVVLERGFGFPNDVVSRIEAERVTGLAGVPTLWAMLLQLKEPERRDLSSIRYLTNAAAAMPTGFIEPVRRLFPTARLYLMHGQTECLRTTYLPPDQLDVRPTSVGTGMAGVELWLEDDTGRRLPAGSQGELVVRGENVMLGYWNDPVATAKVVRPGRTPTERELRTGDLFRTDADGYLSFVARRDDIIKSRGEKISPLEIEQLLYARPEVFEARVIGVPDEVLGQRVRAEIVLRPGVPLAEAELRRYLRERLEPHKVPQTIAFVDALPKTAGGKITRTP